MRKRSEAVAATVDPRQQTIPGTNPTPKVETSPDALPDGCSVENNVFFIKCSDCGMHQGYLMTKRPDGPTGQARCFRCDKPFDPVIAQDYVDKARERWRSTTPPQKNGAPPPQPKQESAPVVTQPPVGTAKPFIEKCETCGERVTETGLGKFYPCGHDPKKQAVAAAPPPKAETKESKPVHVTNNHVAVVGERIIAVYGRELFQPKQFNTFEIGPFTYETVIRPDEHPEDAANRALEVLRKIAQEEFTRKMKDYLNRLEGLIRTVQERNL